MSSLTRSDIRRLLGLLDDELSGTGTVAELYMVGGAVMCAALGARDATRDIDAMFRPTAIVREAAARVAVRANVPDGWLNDAVKGFLGSRGEFDTFLDLPNLRVFVARPEYLLAMKCVALRLGEEFHDLDDIRYLLRYLDVTDAGDAMEIVTRYFDADRVLLKTRLALEELLGPKGAEIRQSPDHLSEWR